MTVEIPEFTRCCFCLPLRPGLLAWGYFKILVNALVTPVLAYFLLSTLVLSLYGGNSKRYAVWILLFAALALGILILFITDFIAAIVFVVAGHQKNAKMLRGYFIYSIGVFIVTVLLIVIGVGISIVNWSSHQSTLHLLSYAAYLLLLVVQAYFILLMRSEVNKLNGVGEVRYVNNSAESQYMMPSKEREATADNV